MSITKTFDESGLMDLIDAELGGQNYLLIKGLFDHTRTLEAMLKSHEWTPCDGTNNPVWCRACHGNVRIGHSPDCHLAKLLEGVD